MDTGLLMLSGALGATVLAGLLHLRRRGARSRRGAAALRATVERNQHLPRSLHPVVDPDVCIGSLSCLKACPEGDILGIVDHAARLVHADHCIGHGRCAAECPVGAIKLVFGTAERGVDLPEVDQFFESSRPGVHVVGELGGMGLIRNAVTQGLQVAERLAEVAPPGGVVAVIGAGPAGLATALGLASRGVGYRLLEQDSVGGSVAHYPRRKVAMTEPVVLPLYGKFGKKLMSKEELLAGWGRVIAKAGLRVEQGVKVGAIGGEDGRFRLETSQGPVEAAKVVLATGRRGTPRRLGVPGEEAEKVVYGLTDPEQYDGQRVLVVGGGDSALEAAIQLATESSAEVSLSYRNAELGRCREANRTRFGALVAEGRVRALMPSQVIAVDGGEVRLDQGGRAVRLANDFVVVNIGGELPVEFLQQAGVSMRRYHGEAPGAPAGDRHRHRAPGKRDRRLERRLAALRVLYATAGLAILAWLAWKGAAYYALPRAERLASPLHAALKPAGWWGHGVGIAATVFMLSNFLYAVRKRSRLLTGFGEIRGWLDFHVFVGVMSPLVIAFHAAFQSNNVLASATSLALAVVIATGVVGRFIYGVVPAHGGKAEELEDLAGTFERLEAFAAPELAHAGPAAQALLDRATAPVRATSLLALFVRLPFESLGLRLRLRLLRRRLGDHELHAELREALLKLARLRWQLRFYGSLKRLLRGWRVFHATLAVFLVLAIAAHIGVSLYLGYGLK
ncbi:MAG TPA: NAD(P)-binding domain-containing protein [Anaeromyxobacteraceae bacterium]|nr:NAD(P)-binding domain-containing protein [Anaeromyxobacteraceae bacterium]